jgi:S-adenosylmethionine/arginine decarboxylase-like enzyme
VSLARCIDRLRCAARRKPQTIGRYFESDERWVGSTPDIQHKHLIIRAEVSRPPNADGCAATESWLLALIGHLQMRVMFGPRAQYCARPGNRGLTAFAIIETSHIALHTWDECDPPLIQLDIYTCSDLPLGVAFRALEVWAPTKVEYKFLDRETSLTTVEQGWR